MPIDKRLLDEAAAEREKLAPGKAPAADKKADSRPPAAEHPRRSAPPATEASHADLSLPRFPGMAPIILASVCALLTLVTRLLPLESLPYRDNIYLSIVLLQILTLLLPGIFYAKLRGARASSLLRLPPPRDIPFVLVSTLILILAVTAAKTVSARAGFYTSAYNEYSPYLRLVSTSSVGDVVYIVVAFALLPALAEGFVLRGLVTGEFISDGFGVWRAVLLSGVVSALLGMSLQRLAINFIAGVILAYIAALTGSVFPAVFAQLMLNLADLFGDSFVVSLAKGDYCLLFMLVVLALTGLFTVWALAEAEKHYYISGLRGLPSPPAVRWRGILLRALFSPATAVLAVIFAVQQFIAV